MFSYIALEYLTEDKFLYTTAPTLLAAEPVKSTGWLPGKKNNEILPPIGTQGVLQTVKNTAELLISVSMFSLNDRILSLTS